jgi:peptidoglycan biosynthesis protein MviN/MurJ (putative lipid II flippase)
LGLALALVQPLGAGGLALSNGLAVSVEVCIMLVIANRRLHGIYAGEILNTLVRTLLAALVMGLAITGLMRFLPGLHPALAVGTGATVGVITYLAVGLLLGVQEIRYLSRVMRFSPASSGS